MSRIQSTFAALRHSNKTGLVPFITAGDPAPELTVPLMHALVAGGADVLELGVPFSDPMAEGPVIQRACERALTFGVGMTRRVRRSVASSARPTRNTPVVLMGYANPIERMGPDALRAAAPRPPAPTAPSSSTTRPRNAKSSRPRCSANGLDLIFLLAPTSTASASHQVAQLRQRLQLLRLAQGCDRRRRHRHRRRGRSASPRSASTSSCRSASASASATPRPPGRWPRWRTRS